MSETREDHGVTRIATYVVFVFLFPAIVEITIAAVFR